MIGWGIDSGSEHVFTMHEGFIPSTEKQLQVKLGIF
jgi:hypothetical protein